MNDGAIFQFEFSIGGFVSRFVDSIVFGHAQGGIYVECERKKPSTNFKRPADVSMLDILQLLCLCEAI